MWLIVRSSEIDVGSTSGIKSVRKGRSNSEVTLSGIPRVPPGTIF